MNEGEGATDLDESKSDITLDPLSVKIVETEKLPPSFGSLLTFTTTVGNTVGPQQILKQDVARAKARILVYAGAGAAATAFVLVGARGQVQNGQGGQLLAGTNLEINSSHEFWLNGDGVNLMTVTVLNERYD